jgi:beta-lactamase regulating signal transducer with metallopeptidase domain
MPLLRRTSSAARRLVLAMSLGGALALPLVSAALPSWRVHAPRTVMSLSAFMVADPLVPASPSEVVSTGGEAASVSSLRAEPTRGFDAMALMGWVWAAGATLVLARLLVGLFRTRRMVRRATPARAWSFATGRAREVTGHPVDVRATGELDTPAVAGVLAPVILVPALRPRRGSSTYSSHRARTRVSSFFPNCLE